MSLKCALDHEINVFVAVYRQDLDFRMHSAKNAEDLIRKCLTYGGYARKI